MKVVLGIVLAACVSLPAQADIAIGIAGPLSGPNAVFGAELRNGVSAAIAAVNAAGGVNGEQLALVEGDDACDTRRAGEVAKDFISKDVRLVVGHFCSSASLAAAPAYAQAGVLLITPSATLPEITNKSLWNVFRLTGRDDLQGAIAAARIKTDGKGAEVVVISDGLAESADWVRSFRNALPNAKSLQVKAGDGRLPDDPALVTATAVYLALQPVDGAAVARELRKLNPDGAFFGPDSLQAEVYGNRAAEAANGSLITFLQDWSITANPQRAQPIADKQGAALAAYAAVETFVTAAKARDVNDPRAMASWLRGGNAISTIIGTMQFNASGDLQTQPYVWYVWRDGVLLPEQKSN